MKHFAGIFLVLGAAVFFAGWSASDSARAIEKLEKHFENVREDLAAGKQDKAYDSILKMEKFLKEQGSVGSPAGRGRTAIKNYLREAASLSRRAAKGDVVLNKRLEATFARIAGFFEIHVRALERESRL